MARIASLLRTYALVSVIMLALGFGGGWLTARLLPLGGDFAALIGPGLGANSTSPAELRNQFQVFWETWNLVENEFYHREPLDNNKMIEGAIKGMLASLDDPYTVYQEPDLAALTQDYMKGSEEGIGVYLRYAGNTVFVDRPIKNSPAFKAGLLAGDQIMAIDGADIATMIEGMDINKANVEVSSRVRGQKGTSVTLTIRREGQADFDVAIVRDEIITSSVSGQMLDSDLAYIKITDFKSSTTADFDDTLAELLPNQPTGLVLDLRGNPGGFLTNAQDVLGRFYSGVALYEENGAGDFKELNTTQGGKNMVPADLPVVVLVNANSASASEIVAGALRDKRPNTWLLGETTYGKGSVQNIHTLTNQGSARITIAHWLTPNKSAIHGVGITPQYVVPYAEDAESSVPCVADRQPAEGQQTCADNQLVWAIRMLATGETPPLPAT